MLGPIVVYVDSIAINDARNTVQVTKRSQRATWRHSSNVKMTAPPETYKKVKQCSVIHVLISEGVKSVNYCDACLSLQ